MIYHRSLRHRLRKIVSLLTNISPKFSIQTDKQR
jgi:hypothetical protein